MDDILIKFKNADEDKQLKMFSNLQLKSQLLQIATLKKNAEQVPFKILVNISFLRIINLYNYAKTDELRRIIINDSYFQKVFKKSENCNINFDIFTLESDFFKDFNYIIDTVYSNNYNSAIPKNKKRFIHKYSNIFLLGLGDFQENINTFFSYPKKQHNFKKSDLDKLNIKQLIEIYDHFVALKKYNTREKDCNSSDEFISNQEDMEKYLKELFNKKTSLHQLASDFLSCKKHTSHTGWNHNIYNKVYSREEIIKFLNVYFKFYQNNEDMTNKVLNFLVEKFNLQITDSELKSFIKYKIKKLILYNPSKIIDLMYKHWGLDTKQLIIMLQFDFLFSTKHYFNTIYLIEFDNLTLINLNCLHIRNIFNSLDATIGGDEILYRLRIALNLYFVFGYNRSLDILNGKYGEINRNFFDNISKISVNNNPLDENNNVRLNQAFLNMLFNEEKNSNFSKIVSDINLCQLIPILYNQYDEIIAKYGKLNLKKCIDLINENNGFFIHPSNNRLKRPDIYNNIIVGNRRNVNLEYLIKHIEENYAKQQIRTTSSLPYLEGECNGYTYQTMRLNDPIVYNLGYLTDCCFRITDIGEDDLRHATLDKNSRILLVYNENKDIISFSVLNRNGEVVIITSVEFDSSNNKIKKQTLLQIIKDFSERLYNEMNASGDRIKLITIGANSKIKPEENIPFPSKYHMPMCSKKDKYQANFYHRKQHIVIKDENLDYNGIRYETKEDNFIPEYRDPRLKIQRVVINEQNINQYIDLIERIDNKLHNDILSINDVLIFNEDWYILIKEDRKVIIRVLDYDDRAKEEYNYIMNNLSEIIGYVNTQTDVILGNSSEGYQKKLTY